MQPAARPHTSRPGSRRRLAALLLAGLVAAGACGAPAPGGGAAGGSGATSGGGPGGAPAATGRAAYPAASDEEIKVRASWCAVAGAMFPLWIGKEAGIFQRHRLDVELIYAFAAEPNIAGLIQRDLDFVECAGASLIP